MLLNQNFLLKLDAQQNTETFARVTLLTNKELPIERIEGRITNGGSISLDGNSAIRRTCSLSFISNNTNFHEYYWTVKSKFKLEIGVKNNVDSLYPDIIWFSQGIYVFTSFSVAYSTNNFTVSLQGKDKGCLINGEISGSFSSSVDLGTIENIDSSGVSTISKLEIKDILVNLMHQYAGEPLKNIIINDLNENGLELLEYKRNKKMFLLRETDSFNYRNLFFEDTSPIFYDSTDSTTPIDFTKEVNGLETLVDTLEGSFEPSIFYDVTKTKTYYIAKVEYGQTAGYKKINLVYAGDLIANVGDSITSVLDKIKNMLGHYEYFYDIEGRFVFQKKRYYVNTPIGTEGNEIENLPQQEQIDYIFQNFKTFSSFNNSPTLANLKNDFSIWGSRKTITGTEIPIHLRYAIDEKPIQYTTIPVDSADPQVTVYNQKYNVIVPAQTSVTYISADSYSVPTDSNVVYCDWREVIYHMALDHFNYGFLDDFELRIIENNSAYYPTGVTGYEQYYIDLLGFWRDLYFPEIHALTNSLADAETDLKNKQEELEEMIKEVEDLDVEDYKKLLADIDDLKGQIAVLKNKIGIRNSDDYYTDTRWNKSKDIAPETLNFWFDFLDSENQVACYGVKKIGTRAKIINDSSIKAIYFRKTPDVVFDEQQIDFNDGYKHLQVPGLDKMFSPSAQGKSAKETLDSALQTYLFSADSVSIGAKPIYYLEPNIKIRLIDDETKTHGDYIVSKITLPLTYNGTMSITATKAVKNIF